MCSDEVLLSLLNLPEGVVMNENVKRETIQTEHGTIHNGKAKLSVSVPDGEKLKELRQWSLEKTTLVSQNGLKSQSTCRLQACIIVML